MIHRSIQASPAVWYIFRTTRQKWAANWFDANGIEAWYPTQTIHRTRVKAGRQVRVPEEKAVVSGYVFASFRPSIARRGLSDANGTPIWHEIARRAVGRIIGVVSVNGVPRRFTDAEMLQMQQVPHRLERIRQEQIEASTIRPGDEALHPTLGRVQITGVDGRLARFIVPLFGGEREVVADVVALEKVA